MKNKILIPLICAMGLFSLLSFCNYHSVSELPNSARGGDSKVTIESRVYTPEESKQFLKRDLLSRGVQPIQITIHNNTASTITIENIDTPQVRAGEIARKISKDALPRSVAYRVASLVFWPFAVPATMDGIKSLQTYSKMKRDFAAKSVKLETIAPFSTLNRVLFVPKEEVKSSVTLTLYDQHTGKLKEYKTPLNLQETTQEEK